MSGKELKEIVMRATGLGFVDIANKMGITSQALNTVFKSPDVKTGHLENLVKSLGITLNVIYPDLCTQVNTQSCKDNDAKYMAGHYTQPYNSENIVMQHLMDINNRLVALMEGKNNTQQNEKQ